ncbi:metal-dependent transcriptional regulator [Gephyromycinifex aptenodytis]|uniref:metal-dependent transcriptional regulator n=1 Tax=Gephyromycinifex aptenodytis TaxID=2716227 RepID=UPI0014460D61|nr:metal-dependent transcriptional regulator [Gephyromycinifex aptenodytis]
MTDLIDTTEMYLRIVFELEEEGVPVLRARIVERLGHSGPTVSQTVGRMERDGLLTVKPDRSVVLSAEGRRRATRVMRKHRLAERLLSDVLGLEYAYVHDEACRWEHVISERVERKILKLLADHERSPYGNPIPGLAELGLEESQLQAASPATSVDAPGRVVLERIGEPLQVDGELLDALRTAGMCPGVEISLATDDTDVVLSNDAGQVRLTRDQAVHVFVRPVTQGD